MFSWWGQAVVRWRWLVLAAAAVFVLVAAGWGSGVFGALSSGGFADPDSESARAYQRISEELGIRDVDLLVLYSSRHPVDDPQVREPVTAALAQLRQHPTVASVVDWYDTQSPALISHGRRATYAAIQLSPTDSDEKITAYREVEPLLTPSGVDTQVGGMVMFLIEAAEQTETDILRAELLSAPILLV